MAAETESAMIPAPPASSDRRLAPAPNVRWAGDEDHTILLDLASGEYFMLNGAGSRVWRLLDRGSSVAGITSVLAGHSPAPEAQVRQEVDELLAFLSGAGLVATAAEDPARTGQRRPPRPTGPSRLTGEGLVRRPPASRTAIAWAILARCDFLAARRGLRGLLAALPACPPSAAADEAEVLAVLAAVDRAASLHVRKAWCLPRSAAATWLLRRRGIAARMVLGARPVPFFAHAWVEIDGHALAEDDSVDQLHVLERF